jgi:CheY-like chemotaxis protein
MPHLGGVSLLRALRQAKTGVRIVLMSGYPLDQEGRRLLGAGQVTWVQKPLSAERLARVVAEALAQQPPPDDIDHPPPPPP